jgi:hypothetical protein
MTASLSRVFVLIALGLVTFVLPSGAQTKTRGAARPTDDEFFIISSIDRARSQVLVKRPTEVTEVIRVDAATRYIDDEGKAIALDDLRAGDTVFIRISRTTNGHVAAEIRKGPMTVDELQRRYLQRARSREA